MPSSHVTTSSRLPHVVVPQSVRFAALLLVAFGLGNLSGWGGLAIAGGAASPKSARCSTPHIDHVGTFGTSMNQTVRIRGTCLGHQTAYSYLDNAYLQIRKKGKRGWSACHLGTGFNRFGQTATLDRVNCAVTKWTNTELVFSGFGEAFGKGRFKLHRGDSVAVSLVNPDRSNVAVSRVR